ncbi:unnamed protein product [Periconia digitata]|uniref:Uncharacterized protein n=1 Tax=Periconia digitata TaxID=1303443 RepID=A0A9W4U576_9PLEO|nr:unnamed protein product [Periconia digitata]
MQYRIWQYPQGFPLRNRSSMTSAPIRSISSLPPPRTAHSALRGCAAYAGLFAGERVGRNDAPFLESTEISASSCFICALQLAIARATYWRICGARGWGRGVANACGCGESGSTDEDGGKSRKEERDYPHFD